MMFNACMTEIIKKEYRIKADLNSCREAWLKPEHLTKWLADAAYRDTPVKGDYVLAARCPNISGRHFLKKVSDSQLTFHWFADGEKSTLNLLFESIGEDETLLTLTHEYAKGARWYPRQPWEYNIPRLRGYLEDGKAQIDLTKPSNPFAIDLTIDLKAGAAEVWQALITPDAMHKWWNKADGENGCVVEPEVGGRYSFGWTDEESKTDGPGHITVFDPAKELRYTWYGGKDEEIHWKIETLERGDSRILFRHNNIYGSSRDIWSYRLGWANGMHSLKWYLERGEIGGAWIQ